MNIKEFTEKFPVCPKCGKKLNSEYSLWCTGVRGTFPIKRAYLLKDKVKLSFEDPLSNIKRIDISIDYDSGAVRVYNATKKSDIDKFQDFSFSLTIGCKACGFNDATGFEIFFYGRYDQKIFAFSSFNMYCANFTYAVDDIVYIFGNNKEANNSTLGVYKLNTGASTLNALPFIELDVFDFSDKEKMKHKLQNIVVLA